MAIHSQETSPHVIPPHHDAGDPVAWQQVGLEHPDMAVQSQMSGPDIPSSNDGNELSSADDERKGIEGDTIAALGGIGLGEIKIDPSTKESSAMLQETAQRASEKSKYKIEQEITEVCTILDAIRVGRTLTLEDEDDPFRGSRLSSSVDDRARVAPRQGSHAAKKHAMTSAQSLLAVIERPDDDIITNEVITELNTFIIAKADAGKGRALRGQERILRGRLYDRLSRLVEEGDFVRGDQQKACFAMAKMIETGTSYANGNIQKDAYSGVSVEEYVGTVFEFNLNNYRAAYNEGSANDVGRGLATGSRTGDILLLQAASIGSEVSYTSIGKGKFLRAQRYGELCGIAEKAGLSNGLTIKVAASHISRDFGDFEEIGGYLLGKATSIAERMDVVGALCEGFLTNSVDKTVEANKRRGYNYAGEVFNFAHEYQYNQPLPASRSIQPGLYLLNKIQNIDMDQEGLSAYRQAIVRDMLLHVREAVLRPECMDATAEQLEQLSEAVPYLNDEERIAGLSNIISAFDMVVSRKNMTTLQRNVKDLLEMRRTFMPTFEEDGSVGNAFIDQIKQVTDDMADNKSAESAYCRFICADMAAEYIEAISTMDIPENLMKQRVKDLMDIFDEAYQTDIRQLVLYRAKTEHDRREMMHELTNSVDDILAEYDEFALEEYGTETPELSPDAITKEVARIKDKIGVSINVSIDNLTNILIEPPHRFRSTFENAARGKLDGYIIHRDLGEEAMGVRRLATDLLSDPQPIYGAITSPNGRDEVLGGAGAGFGGAFVELDVDNIADRTLAVPLDSGRYWRTRLMRVPLDYAARFAAINNLANKKYPEAIIMGGVNVSDIKKINIDVKDSEQVRTLVDVVREIYPFIEVAFVDRSMATARKQSILTDNVNNDEQEH